MMVKIDDAEPSNPPAEDARSLPGRPGRIGNFLEKARASPFHAFEVSGGKARLALGVLLIFTLVLIVYRPILPGNFLMDDSRLVEADNPLVNGEFTPRTIWFQTDFTLSTFVFWLEWQAWGKNPGGYHAVSMALQALSAVLVWRLLARLKIPGAWLAGAMFAIHPVGVNSVARIAELKNTLSLPFFLLSFWTYLHYESCSLYPAKKEQASSQRPNGNGTQWYVISLMAFMLALMGKTSTVMLPVVLLGCAAWQRGRITRRDLLHTSPHFVLALAFGLMSVWFQKHQALVSAGETLPPESFLERLAIAGNVFWFYLGKALLPLNLNLIYPHWKIDEKTMAAYLPAVVLCGVFILCWRFRRSWGRHMLFGLGCFAVTLFPALGFFDSQFLTKWQVSDHLQYLPLIAPVALVAAGLASLLPKNVFRSMAVVILLALSVLAFERARVFATEENLLRDTLAKNPAADEAHNDLGVILAKRNDYSGAMDHFAAAVQHNPNNAAAHSNLGQALAINGKFAEAEPHFLAAIKLKPDDPLAHRRFADALIRQGRNREAIFHLQMVLCLSPKSDIQTRLSLAALFYQTGDARQAADQFRKVLLVSPNLPGPLNNLAWLLATSSDDKLRNGAEAVRCAERACQLTAFKRAGMTGTLAAAYAEAGRFPEAITTGEMTVKLATDAGNPRLADISNQLLNLYRAGKPFHEQPAAGKKL